jgi:hypothetical protein
MTLVRLREILETMNVPSPKRDVEKIENLRWLLRNLPTCRENFNHPDFIEAIRIIGTRLRGS